MTIPYIAQDIFSKFTNLSWISSGTIFLTLTGSRSYNLHTEESDYDFKGICIPNKEYFLGYANRFEQAILKAPNPDTTIFDIRKFFKLTTENNPNCLEILYTDPEDHLFCSELGKELLKYQSIFLSKQLKERYIGYAKAEAHKIRQHKRWLENPSEHPPTRQECGLPEKPLIEKNQFDAIKALINSKLESWNPDFEPFTESQKIYLQGKVADILTEMSITKNDKWLAAARTIGLDENLILLIKKEKEFENKIEDYNNYQRWKKNRNPKRAALEAKYLYDTKNALNLVRLLRQGKEILETGSLKVKRIEDREELMSIRNGAWKYEDLISYADKLEEEVKVSYQNSKLPNQPNIKLLDNLCISLVEKHLYM